MGQIKHNKQKAKHLANSYHNKKPLNKFQQEQFNEILNTDIPNNNPITPAINFEVKPHDGGVDHWGKSLMIGGTALLQVLGGITAIMPKAISGNNQNNLLSNPAKMNHQTSFNAIGPVATRNSHVAPKLVKQETLPQQFTLTVKDNTLIFKGAYLDPQVLRDTLLVYPNIDTFDVRGYIITPKIAGEVGRAFENTGVKKLELWGAELGSEGALALAKELKYTNVENLNLGRNKIGANGIKKVVMALKGTKVEILNLQENDIGFQETANLAQAFRNTKITTLNLAMNNLGDKGVLDVAKDLKYTDIKILNLQKNNIGAKGAVDLVKALKDTKVTTLSLAHNNIGFKGALDLVKELKDKDITKLNLSYNGIYDKDVPALIKELKCTKVTELGLWGYYSTLEEILHFLEGNSHNSAENLCTEGVTSTVKPITKDATTTVKSTTTEEATTTVKPTTTEEATTTMKPTTTEEAKTEQQSTAKTESITESGVVTTEGKKSIDLLSAEVVGVPMAFFATTKEANTEQQFTTKAEPITESGVVTIEEKKSTASFLAKVIGIPLGILVGIVAVGYSCNKKTSDSDHNNDTDESYDSDTNETCDYALEGVYCNDTWETSDAVLQSFPVISLAGDNTDTNTDIYS